MAKTLYINLLKNIKLNSINYSIHSNIESESISAFIKIVFIFLILQFYH